MLEQGVEADHTTIYRWVQTYSPELDKRYRPSLVEQDQRFDESLVLLYRQNLIQ